MRGDIYYADLGSALGSIQGGTRPVLIVQNNMGNMHAPTTIVCPITSAMKHRLPTHVNLNKSGGLVKDSIVLCEQIMTINKHQLRNYIGSVVDPFLLGKINKALNISLGISEEYVI